MYDMDMSIDSGPCIDLNILDTNCDMGSVHSDSNTNADSDISANPDVMDTNCNMGLHSNFDLESNSDNTMTEDDRGTAEPILSATPLRPKKWRMAYVLVPSVKRQSTPHSLPPSTISAPLSVHTAAVPGQLSVEEEGLLSSFMLTDDELKDVSYTGSAYLDAEETFKYTYGIDLDKVPGRTRKWSNFHGM